ncbi:MAG: FAD:protein FMN transferase [Pseudobutyrivibrio sp.]|nr:FAD:protein FMN transferase [Pseudobutyrivibrio sp.]
MDTVMELKINGDKFLLTDSEHMIRNLEKKISVTDDESEIYELNHVKKAILSDQSIDVLEGAIDVCNKTDGALDISIYPVLKLWGFTTGEYNVPDSKMLDDMIENVDHSKIQINGNTVEIPENMEIDLGSVAKGYTGTMVADYLKENSVTSALINLGGNVQCIGSKPNGDPWNVAIKSPFFDSNSGIIGVLKASDEAIITSGGYERYFEQDGNIYWHILDPSTGMPANNGIVSVTVVGENGLMCDGLSTALFVMGLDDAINYWKDNNESFDMIVITEDRKIYITDKLYDEFTLSSEYYNMNLTVIS